MTVSREIALGAALDINDGANKVAEGIPQHLLDHPELDPETKEILEMVAVVIPLLTSAFRVAFEAAINAEDSLEEVKKLLDKLETI